MRVGPLHNSDESDASDKPSDASEDDDEEENVESDEEDIAVEKSVNEHESASNINIVVI